MTTVINLLGGSGLGKSTTAAALFAELKMRGYNCELVREFVKNWAWEGRKIQPLDQLYIAGKQSQQEARLYGKVEYVITDSPLLVAPVYEAFYNDGESVALPSVIKFLSKAKQQGVNHLNFVLKRHKPFDPRGRYETAETASKVDAYMNEKLKEWNVPFTTIDCEDRERVGVILERVL